MFSREFEYVDHARAWEIWLPVQKDSDCAFSAFTANVRAVAVHAAASVLGNEFACGFGVGKIYLSIVMSQNSEV